MSENTNVLKEIHRNHKEDTDLKLTVRFSLSLNGRVPVKQPPPQSSCRPAGGGVKCVWSFCTDSLINFLVF